MNNDQKPTTGGTVVPSWEPKYDPKDPNVPDWNDAREFTHVNDIHRDLWSFSQMSYGDSDMYITEADIQALRDGKVLFYHVQGEYGVFIKLKRDGK